MTVLSACLAKKKNSTAIKWSAKAFRSNVPEKPRIQPFSFPIKHRLGKDITVSCFAMEGQPPLKFAWAKDGREISNGAKFTVEQATAKMSTLTIHEVSAADIGNYTCGVSNNEGQ
ncbi:hypothetical protein HPB48_008464 [Haemaphysalis longicornis]|uniref:Ig-like domain-containing protein n=1 Tax=Haemaphysalis longicornis TaxID=44386 RepID=A0A9J6FMB9_HAELO|nr:hypothetical protein HPB48_008464 [Haemaphysalis longicornis]